ncbi:MAG: discoidin domain-containing protein [bacterium]|nr:discoidin domain-containing protein [bacterium]
MNDDGLIGQAGVDDLVCDDTSGTGVQSNDIDGDGQAEDQVYVDCDGAGLDFAGCGGPNNPCATITYAFNTRANGTGSGNFEDIVCFRGTCRDVNNLTPAVGGLAGYRTKPQSGSEAKDWQLPTNPAMLIGWDADGDGHYPPFDTDDTAVIDGGPPNNYNRTFVLNAYGANNSYFEMAHFSVVNYGNLNAPGTDTGFIVPNFFGGTGTHIYLHDLELDRINQDRVHAGASDRSTFNMFGCLNLRYFAAINIKATNIGVYFIRGSCGYGPGTGGPFRWQNISYTAHGADNSKTTIAKMWGYNQGLEFLDSVIDGNASAWTPCGSGGNCASVGFQPAQCTRDWVIRNNELIDLINALHIQAHSSGACEGANARSVDDIVFDRNIYRDKSPHWTSQTYAVTFSDGGASASESSEDVTVTNNFFSSDSYGACLYYFGGNNGGPNPGTITFSNNTCHGDPGFAAIYIDQLYPFPHQSFDIRNNIFSGHGPFDLNLRTDYAPSNWISDFNVLDADGLYSWNNGPQTSLSQWRSNSGGDTSSAECDPLYANEAVEDFHLLTADTCAQNQGMALPAINRDIDGDPRPQGAAFEIGADEISTGNSPPSVSVSSPSNGSTFSDGASISFSGSASDAEDGVLTTNLSWSSSIDGPIGSGGSFLAVLSVGNHTVTGSVIDSGGLTGSDSVSVTVEVVSNNAPAVTISSPAPASCSLAVGEAVTSSGNEFPGREAAKLVDGMANQADVFWAADGNGNWVEIDLGTEQTVDSLKVAPFAGSPGNPYFYDEAWTVQYRDSAGVLQHFASVGKTAGAGTLAGPGISITDGRPGITTADTDYMYYEFDVAPVELRYVRITVTIGDRDLDSNGAELELCRSNLLQEGTQVSFSGAGTDIEDGDLTASLVWTSNIDGVIGSGGAFQAALTPGFHTVTAAVTDSGGLVGFNNVSVTIFVPCTSPQELVLANDTVISPEIHLACNSITAGPSYAILSGGDVELQAGQVIRLQDGFSVEAGGAFKASIVPMR